MAKWFHPKLRKLKKNYKQNANHSFFEFGEMTEFAYILSQ